MSDSDTKSYNNSYHKTYQRGYAAGYRRGAQTPRIENMYGGGYPEPMYVPYAPITYYTAVILMITMFLIFILILGYINERPVGYITRYNGDCLLKLSATYGAIDCL